MKTDFEDGQPHLKYKHATQTQPKKYKAEDTCPLKNSKTQLIKIKAAEDTDKGVL
jgi:hypothetical protein